MEAEGNSVVQAVGVDGRMVLSAVERQRAVEIDVARRLIIMPVLLEVVGKRADPFRVQVNLSAVDAQYEGALRRVALLPEFLDLPHRRTVSRRQIGNHEPGIVAVKVAPHVGQRVGEARILDPTAGNAAGNVELQRPLPVVFRDERQAGRRAGPTALPAALRSAPAARRAARARYPVPRRVRSSSTGRARGRWCRTIRCGESGPRSYLP